MTYTPGLFSSFFWEQEFDEVRESFRTLELFDVQIWKWRILLVSMVIRFKNMLVLYYMCILFYN